MINNEKKIKTWHQHNSRDLGLWPRAPINDHNLHLHHYCVKVVSEYVDMLNGIEKRAF